MFIRRFTILYFDVVYYYYGVQSIGPLIANGSTQYCLITMCNNRVLLPIDFNER